MTTKCGKGVERDGWGVGAKQRITKDLRLDRYLRHYLLSAYNIHITYTTLTTSKILGKMAAPNRIFQTAFDPPPSFSENYVPIFFIMDMVVYMQDGTRAS